MDDDEGRAVVPNTTFLSRMLQGVQRGNQRVIDTNASRAANKARCDWDRGFVSQSRRLLVMALT